MKINNTLNTQKRKFQATLILMISVAVHLTLTHAKLLFHLNTDKSTKSEQVWSLFKLGQEYAFTALILALAYSLGTIAVAYQSRHKWWVIAYSIMDGIAVLLYYAGDWHVEQIFKGLYYGIFTGMLSYSIYLVTSPSYLSDRIDELRERGLNQKEIANELGVSQSKVSRVNGKKAKVVKTKS